MRPMVWQSVSIAGSTQAFSSKIRLMYVDPSSYDTDGKVDKVGLPGSPVYNPGKRQSEPIVWAKVDEPNKPHQLLFTISRYSQDLKHAKWEVKHGNKSEIKSLKGAGTVVVAFTPTEKGNYGVTMKMTTKGYYFLHSVEMKRLG